MGAARNIANAFFGPLIVYGILVGHIFFRLLIETPPPLNVQDFPKGTGKDVKDAVVSNRQQLIRDLMDALAGKARTDFLDTRCTDDIEFEDFFMRWQGRDEFALFLGACSRMVRDLQFEVHSEHHGPHEVVMDWTLTPTLSGAQWLQVPLRMRTHVLLEPPSQVGGQERIFRVYEEWNGNRQLNEKTTFAPLGKVHQRLRRFNGWFAGWFMQNFVMNFNEDYFLYELAGNMLDVEDIRRRGYRVDPDFVMEPDGARMRRVVFASYPRTPALFAVLATREVRDANGTVVAAATAAYVGVATYGCVLEDGEEEEAVAVGMQCRADFNWIEVMALTFAVIVGAWLCLLGRHFFALSHLAYGGMAGGAAGCVLAEIWLASHGFGARSAVVTAFGALGAAAWLGQWLLLGWPRLSLLLPGLLAGAVPAGAVLFSAALNVPAFTDNTVFWSTAFAISASVSLLLLLFPRQGAVAASAALGAALLALAADYAVVGGALKYYAAVDFVRRAAAVDGDFADAVTSFPMQPSDFELLGVTFLIMLVSVLVQSSLECDEDFPNNDLKSLTPTPILPPLSALCGHRRRRFLLLRGGNGGGGDSRQSSSVVVASEELEPLLAEAIAGGGGGGDGGSRDAHNAAIRAALHAMIDARFPIAEERPVDDGDEGGAAGGAPRSDRRRTASSRRQASAPAPPSFPFSPPPQQQQQQQSPPSPTAPPPYEEHEWDVTPAASSSRLNSLFGGSVRDGLVDPESVRRARRDPFKPPSPQM